MISKYKIGVGLVTCDREHYLKQSLEKFLQTSNDVDYFCLVNDGEKLSTEIIEQLKTFNKPYDLVQHFPKHQSVGKCKNQIMKNCLKNDCDFIFLVEDDMLIQNENVYRAYIHAMNASGIFHMNYSQHGTANKKENGEKNPRHVIDYGNGIEIGLFPNLVGSFNVFHKNILKNIGLYDETFKNAFEHVEHTYNIINSNLHPPFWYFADLFNSNDYIREIEGSIQNSTRINSKDNEVRGFKYFQKKHKVYVNEIPNVSFDVVQKWLEFLKENYSNKLEL